MPEPTPSFGDLDTRPEGLLVAVICQREIVYCGVDRRWAETVLARHSGRDHDAHVLVEVVR